MTAELVPIEQRDVEWKGEILVAVLIDEGEGQEIYVPVQPICDYLDLNWRGQRARIQRDDVLSEVARLIKVVRPRGGEQGGTVTQGMLSLPLRYLNGWLFGINASRVKEEFQEKVKQYQRDCYNILAQAFGISEAGLVVREETALSPQAASLAQIRDVALAVAQMAQDMILQEGRLTIVEGNTATLKARLDEAARYVGGLEKRLRTVEERTAPRGVVSEDEADEIRAKIVALADLIAGQQAKDEKDKKKQRAPHQTVYHTVYTHFSVSSYKRIRKADYEKVLEFLDGWKNRILEGEQDTEA